MRIPVLWLVALAGIGSLILAACGGNGDESAVRDTVEGFVEAVNEDPPLAYTYLAEECKDGIPFIEFASGLTLLQGFLGEADIEVRDIEIVDKGDDEIEALFVVYLIAEGEKIPLPSEFGAGDDGPTHLVKEDGRWRFGDCAGFQPNDQTSAAAPAFSASLVVAIAAEADDDPALPGEFVDLQAIYGGFYGNRDGPTTAPHVNGPEDYGSQGLPPAGGPHWGSNPCGLDANDAPPLCGPVMPGFYAVPWAAESLVHTMEHSGVIIWYNTQDETIIDDLRAFAEEHVDSNLVITPYPEMEGETVAITAWSRRDKIPAVEYDRARLQRFLDVNGCRFDPEDFCE